MPDGTSAYREPMVYGRPVAWYEMGTRVAVRLWVEGEQLSWDDALWAEIDQGVFVHGRALRQRLSRLPVAPSRTPDGRWIAINRTLQTIAAFEGRELLFWSPTSTGRPGWETPLGTFRINRRVARQTMDSRTLGSDAARASYRIENVRFVQYFDYEGNALHENYWVSRDLFGLPMSHGCAGLTATDAARFWEFGDLGVPVIVHL
ncbi:MAG: L,D-transpeptidase [Chloroflexi bacterium]|nr:L,D-transpeptidase [Chloroflexota bacterium]